MYYQSRTLLAAAAICVLPVVAQRTTDANGNSFGTTIVGDSDSGSTTTINYNSNSNGNGNCPNNQVSYQQDDKFYCCPGTIFGDDNNQFCCVGAKFEVSTPSFASCFPTCTDAALNGASNVATSTQSCSTSIFFSDSDYSSLAQAAAASLSGSSGGSASSATTTTGAASSSSGTSGAGFSASNTGSASSSAATGSSGTAASTSDQSTGGAAMVTSGPMLGGFMAAGGLLMAL